MTPPSKSADKSVQGFTLDSDHGPTRSMIFICRSTIQSIPEFRSCVNVEVDVLGSPSLIVLMVSVDVKQH